MCNNSLKILRNREFGLANYYTCRIIWSAVDGEHLGLCTEFPSLSWLAPSSGEALSGIREQVSNVLADSRQMENPGRSPHGLRL